MMGPKKMLTESMADAMLEYKARLVRDFAGKPMPVIPKEVNISFESDKEFVDYVPTDREREFVKVLEQRYPQMAPILLLSIAGLCAWKNGLLLVGPSGLGKSAVLEALASLPLNIVRQKIWADALSPAGARSEGIDEQLSNHDSTIFIDDLSTFLDSYTGADSFKLFSQLIYHGSWHGFTRLQATIENARVKVYIGGTPISVANLIDSDLWSSHIKERFFRIFMHYYNRPQVTTERAPNLSEFFKDVDVDVDLKWNVSAEMMEKCKDMLSGQFTPTRQELFIRKFLTGNARMNLQKEVNDENAKFFLMFEPFSIIQKNFTFRFKEAVHKDFYTAGNLKFIDIFSEVLFWIAEYPRSYEQLEEITGLTVNFLKEIVEKLEQQVGVVASDGVKIRCVGRFAESLKHIYKTFGCEIAF